MEQEKKKTCKFCGESIPFLAKKCQHCSEWQNRWKRFLHSLAKVVAVVLVLGGWFADSYIDRDAKRRDIQATALINSFRAIANVSLKGSLNSDDYEALESLSLSLSEMQLLGTPELVKQARSVVEQVEKWQSGGEKIEMDNLGIELRDALRHDLSLDKVDLPFKILTVRRIPKPNGQP